MRVIMWSHWHPNSNGTEYYAAVGEYANLEDAREDATAMAWDRYEELSPEEQEEEGIEDTGPDVGLYDYDTDPEEYDMQRAGGGSYADDFARL